MGEEFDPQVAADRAALARLVRAKVGTACREVAARNEGLASLIRDHDEACATSMEFAATRLRRIADRLEQ